MVLLTEISPQSSSSTHRYDVFLSFRGSDTRNAFTDHLYNALLGAGFDTFLDDEEIETGGSLKPELESAIKSSRASVIVLSKNYASSTWCLDELVLILEQQRSFKQIVIPIFYHVEPTDVRKQKGSFRDAIEMRNKRMEAETDAEKRRQWVQKMESWKKALTQVADLKGKVANGRKETELIEEVVTEVHSRLGAPLSNTLPLLIGMDNDIEFVSSWLTDGSGHTADILTVVGMSGIGKTSLAQYVFRLHSRKFQKSSFIEGVNARCNERFNGLLKLQRQLHADIAKTNPLQVNDVSVYTSKIEKALARNRVFIVLDDIDSLDQLDSLLGNKGLYPGSKIIITTKDASLTERCALFNSQAQPKHKKVSLNGLCKSDSLELLCLHAFKSQKPIKGYEEVLEKLFKYCDGHPLALQVLGKSLHNRDVAYWEECIKGLKKEPHSLILKALQVSFDSLPLKNDKELFKHIACFFVGTDRDVTETILNACDINTRSGITNLIARCLLSISWNNELMMHQLVQEMGRDLVRQESPNKTWERSRLWSHAESFEVLKQNKGTENVLGLALDMRMLEKEQLSGSLQLKTDALNKMTNLKLLQLSYVEMNGSYKNISKELRWLCMHDFHLKSIPSELPMGNLVVLDMSHSNIESFDMSNSISRLFVSHLKRLTGSSSKDKRLLGSLKILDLSFCKQLRSLSDFFELPVLERLIISNCTNLIKVCESIRHCVELVFIDLSNCNKLKKLPRTIGMLKKVKTIVADGCDFSVFPIETRDMDSLQTINASNSLSSSANTDVIPRDLSYSVSILPTSLLKLSLRDSNLSNKSFPTDFSSLSMLKELDLRGNQIVSMPSCVRTLPRLEVLDMSFCKMLKRVEHPPSSLRNLKIVESHTLQEMKFNPEMSVLRLEAAYHEHSFLIEGVIKIQPLAHVEDEVLCSLGWANLELIKYQHLTISKQRIIIQMYFELGIFSTIYEGKEMPTWINCRRKGGSISLTIPSSPNKLRGLNFCCVLQKPSYLDGGFRLPKINIRNTTKKHTWVYVHYISVDTIVAEGEHMIFLSHWMFGKNEMEDGDQLTIMSMEANLKERNGVIIRECGVGLVYDNGRRKEDVLGYYKSWNHIIGGDLSPFQVTTGEYVLYLFRTSNRYYLHHFYNKGGIGFRAFSQKRLAGIGFRSFSQQKSDLALHQSRGGVLETTEYRRSVAVKRLRTKIAIVEFIYNMFKCSKVKTRRHLCFSLKLYTCSRFFHILYFLLVLRSYN